MKKNIVLMMILLIVFTLVGCGKDGNLKEKPIETNKSTVENKNDKTVFKLGEKAFLSDSATVTIIGVREHEAGNDKHRIFVDLLYENIDNEKEDFNFNNRVLNIYDKNGNELSDSFTNYQTTYRGESLAAGIKQYQTLSFPVDDEKSIDEVKLEYKNKSEVVATFKLKVGESIDVNLEGKRPEYDTVYKIGDTIELGDAGEKYSVTIDKVEVFESAKSSINKETYTKNDILKSPSVIPNLNSEVYKITYTYNIKETSSHPKISVDEMNFRVIGDNGFAASFVNHYAILSNPDDIAAGKSNTAEILYSTQGHTDTLIIGLSTSRVAATEARIIVDLNKDIK